MLDHNLIHIRDMTIGEFAIYFLFGAAVLALLVWLKSRGSYRFRIRTRIGEPVTLARDFVNTSRSVFIYQGVQILGRLLILAFGYILTFDRSPPLWQVVLSFPLIMIMHDAYFYWTHRLFHLRPLFRFIHFEHHTVREPTVFASYKFSITEAAIQGSFPLFYVLFFPCTFPTLIFFYIVMILHDVMIHSGVDVFPRQLVIGRFGVLCGTIHHDMHHYLGRTNYGLYLRFWDQLMKTEHPDFEAVYDYVHSPKNDGLVYQKLLRRRPAEPSLTAAPAPAAS